MDSNRPQSVVGEFGLSDHTSGRAWFLPFRVRPTAPEHASTAGAVLGATN
jgi:hypothetical protein